MAYKYLHISIDNQICTLKISNPSQLNALNSSLLKELDEAVSEIEINPDIRVLIITGEGRSFVAGADISEMADLDSIAAGEFAFRGVSVFRKIELLPIPVIAAINGFALGGGCELALACDIRIASENAKLGQPEVSLGITPGFSGTVRLSRIVGLAKAKELIFTGKVIDASEALSIGLLNKVCPLDSLQDEVCKTATMIAGNAPIAVINAKRSINESIDLSVDDAIKNEMQLFASCFRSEDQKEGMKAFLNKTKTKFNNR
ncbi:MAG: enoyl-CoA hydratase-related protein [Rikenellaceae bacterium]|nr:enoyl-CoA hydratase-related protein [Rikenellaceae bacterium]